MLGERGEEAGCGPAFLIGLFGELRYLDRREPQLVEQQGKAGGVDGVGRRHAASPIRSLPIRLS